MLRFILGLTVGVIVGYGLANLLTKPVEPSLSYARERGTRNSS